MPKMPTWKPPKNITKAQVWYSTITLDDHGIDPPEPVATADGGA
jgi:hypothetical protein